MSAQEVGRNHNKNLFMVHIWHKLSVAPFFPAYQLFADAAKLHLTRSSS